MKMQETVLDIYPGRNMNYQKELKMLENSLISARNKELLTEFSNHLFSIGSKQLRVAKVSSQMRWICKWLKDLKTCQNDLDKLCKKDITHLVAFINKIEEKSEATKADYRRALKQFMIWYKDEDSRIHSKNDSVRIDAHKMYSYLEKSVKASYPFKLADPSTIITDEDILKVLKDGARTRKERAFVNTLHEGGMRIGEFLKLKVGDIEVKDNFIELFVPDGKTESVINFVETSKRI